VKLPEPDEAKPAPAPADQQLPLGQISAAAISNESDEA
jgi:hypothetical protein